MFGIPIRIHVTFLIVLPFLALGFGRVFTEAARLAGVPAGQLRGSPFLWGLVVALALFLSVLVHELAHSLYAIRTGGRVREITLLMIGGVSQISEPPRGGKNEAVMALVGPVTSLVLGGAFYALFRAAGSAQFDVKFALFHLFYLNVVLGLFNLLPAFPMDGGRILRGVLAERWGVLRATRVASTAGKGFALLFAILGFFGGNILLMVVAFFVWVGAEAENRGVLVKVLLGHVKVRDLMRANPSAVEASTTAFDVAERMLRERSLVLPVIDAGVVIGIVALADVRAVPAEARAATRVDQMLRRVSPIDGDDEALAAVRALAEARAPAVPVTQGARLVGVLSQADLNRGLQLTELEATQHPIQPGPPDRRIPHPQHV